MASKRIIKYKCLFCRNRYTREDLVNHIGEDHEELIPKDFTPFRLVFNYVNKKPLSYHGCCTECKGPTPWDENKGRYDRQCGKKACHDSYVKKFEDNMLRTRNTTRISLTPEGQKKMLANRKISGTYVMQDGAKKTYTGSYEKKALEFMDKILNIKSDDILCPGPILEYDFEAKTHLYITDFYYQPYNLLIEVKDGGDNPNKRNMPEYRAKQIEKEKYIITNTNYNYLRLTNNDFSQLMVAFAELKMQMIENTGERVIQVNESAKIDPVQIVETIANKYNYTIIARDFDNLGFGVTVADKKDKSIKENILNKIISDIKRSELGPYIKNIIIDWDKESIMCDYKKSLSESNNIIKEMMGQVGTAPVVGMKDSDAYIVNYMQNNVFSDDNDHYALTDNIKLSHIIGRDDKNRLVREDNLLENAVNIRLFKLPITLKEAESRLIPFINKEVSNNFLYEALTGDKLYSKDQILFNESLVRVSTLKELQESDSRFIKNHIYNSDILNEIDKLDSMIYGLKYFLNESEKEDQDSLQAKLKGLNQELNKWDYGVLVDGKVITDSRKVDWSKYKTIPINLIEKYHVGICWDFVNYQHYKFNKLGLKDESYFFVMQLSDDPNDLVTHTFSIVECDGRKWWFESSWMAHQGLHKVDNVDFVVNKLLDRYDKNRSRSYDLYQYNPTGLDKNLTNGEFFKKATSKLIKTVKGGK